LIKNITGWAGSLFDKTGISPVFLAASAAGLIVIAAIILLSVFLVRSRKRVDKLERGIEAAARQKDEFDKKISQLQQQLVMARQQSPAESAVMNEGAALPLEELEAQNKELVYLTKEYLVNDFISLIASRFPQEFNLRAKTVELDVKEGKRLESIIGQLGKIEAMASRYQYKFPLAYYYQKAWYRQGIRDYQGMLTDLREAIAMFHQEDSLYIGITRLLTVMNRNSEAVNFCTQYLGLRPTHADTIRLLVRNLIELKEYKKAEEQCRLLLELTASASDRGLLGYICHLEGYLSRSEEIFEDIAKTGGSEEAARYLALIEEEKGQCKEAHHRIQKAWNREPLDYDAVKACIRLNSMFGYTNQNKKIIEAVRFNGDLDPEIVVLYVQNNTADHAELTLYRDILRKTCEQRGIDSRAWTWLGIFQLKMENWSEAREALQNALADADAPDSARLAMARLWIQQKDFEKARGLIDAVISADPSSLEGRSLLGEYFAILGDAAEAEKIARALADSHARNVHLFERLGLLYLRQKNWKESLYFFNQMEEQGLKNTVLFKNIAFSYFGLEDYENAVRYYNRILEINPTNIDALNNLGVIYSIRKEYRRARKFFQRALQINPESKETNFNLALLYKRINQENSARHYAKYKDLIKQQVNDGPVS